MRPWAPAGRAVPVLQASLCVPAPEHPAPRGSGAGKFFARPFFKKADPLRLACHPLAATLSRPPPGPWWQRTLFRSFPVPPGGRPSPPQQNRRRRTFCGFPPPANPGTGRPAAAVFGFFARPFCKKAVRPPAAGPRFCHLPTRPPPPWAGPGACFQAAGVLGRKGLACQARKSPQGVVSLRAVWFADQYIFSYFFTISPRRIPSARLADSQTLATEVGLLMKCRMTYMSPPFVAAT